MGRIYNGSSDYSASAAPQLATGTIALWMSLVAAPAGTAYIAGYANGPGSSTNDKDLVVENDRTTHWLFFDGGSKNTIPASPAMTLGRWYHQATTFDGTTALHYFNGVQVGSVACAATYTGYSSPQMVVASITGAFANCEVGEISAWSSVLNAPEIFGLAQGTRASAVRADKLLVYIPLENGDVQDRRGGIIHALNGTKPGRTPPVLPRPALGSRL